MLSIEFASSYNHVVYRSGGVVLDPFIGSGTTAIACLKERRHFLGFELNKEYFDIAQRRIALERIQPTLDFGDG